MILLIDGMSVDIQVALQGAENTKEIQERVTSAILPYLQVWLQEVPSIVFATTTRGTLFVFSLDAETDSTVSIRLVDSAELADLQLETDPRSIPIRVGNLHLGAANFPEWDPILLIFGFDAILQNPDEIKETYVVWDSVLFHVMHYRDKNLAVISGIVTPPISYVEGMLL